MEPIIKIKGLTKEYGSKTVLNGIDLDVDRGRILGYIGPNGAGKTTTVKILVGMLGGFLGKVEVCGFNVALSPLEVKQRIGYVPESAALYNTLSPMEFLRFVGTIHGLEKGESEARAEEMLGLFDLSSVIDRRISTFSKGMQQKVLIVSSLIHDPDLIVLDEPLSGLDANSAVMVKEILAGLAGEGKTVFYCSHVMDVVERICDRIVILSDGKIIADGSFDELKSMNKAASLERLFTQLTSSGRHELAATRFIRAFSADKDGVNGTDNSEGAGDG